MSYCSQPNSTQNTRERRAEDGKPKKQHTSPRESEAKNAVGSLDREVDLDDVTCHFAPRKRRGAPSEHGSGEKTSIRKANGRRAIHDARQYKQNAAETLDRSPRALASTKLFLIAHGDHLRVARTRSPLASPNTPLVSPKRVPKLRCSCRDGLGPVPRPLFSTRPAVSGLTSLNDSALHGVGIPNCVGPLHQYTRSARPQKVDIGRHLGVKTQIPGVEHHGRQGGGSHTEATQGPQTDETHN